MYIEMVNKQREFGHKCPICHEIVYSISREVMVNGSDHDHDKWGDPSHIMFVCECGHTWEMIYSRGPWEIDMGYYILAGGLRLPIYYIYHKLAGECPIGRLYGFRTQPEGPEEILVRYINGVDPFFEMTPNYLTGAAKPHENGASVIVPKKFLGTKFLLVPMGKE